MKHCYMYIPFATIRNVFVSHIQIVILKKIRNFAIKFTLTKQINHILEMIYIYWVNIRFLISIFIELTYIVTHFPKTTKKDFF